MKDQTFKRGFHEKANLDTALELTGYGRFHYEIAAACALSIVTVGFQNGVSSYIFPAAQCELHLTSFELGALNVAFLAGGVLSCFLWGNMADVCGRRRILSAAHLSNALSTSICATIPYTAGLILCRLLNGFLIGAPGSVVFSYLSEFQPPKYRSASVCCCGLFFTLSWLLLPALASLVLPLDVDLRLGGFFVLKSWRLLLVLLVVPEVLASVWLMARMPESPRYFAANGRVTEALQVLRRMYAVNRGEKEDSYPVKQLVGEEEEKECRDVACANKTARVLNRMLRQSMELFRPPLLKTTCLTCAIMFSNMFGVFGLGLWFPELFIRFHQYHRLHPNLTVTVKQLASVADAANSTACQPQLDGSVILDTVAMATTSMLYNAVSAYASAKIEAKIITTGSMLVGGASAAAIYWLTTSAQNLAVACVFQAAMVTANMTIGGMGVELFPTRLGGIAVCVIICAGRVGAVLSNVMFGYFVDEHCELPIFAVAVVVLVGAGLCALAPAGGMGPVGRLTNKSGFPEDGRDITAGVVAVIS